MTIKIATGAILLVGFALGGCKHSGLWGDDEFERYTARIDKVTADAGDAPRRNLIVHTNNPYPREAYDHNIPVSAARMSKAIQCYEGVRPTTGTQTETRSVGVAGGGVAVGASSSSSKPSNDC